MSISDWSSDVCSSDLGRAVGDELAPASAAFGLQVVIGRLNLVRPGLRRRRSGRGGGLNRPGGKRQESEQTVHGGTSRPAMKAKKSAQPERCGSTPPRNDRKSDASGKRVSVRVEPG